MILRQKLVLALTVALFTVAANANPVVYLIGDSGQFGTIDLSTGSFTAIGPGISVGTGRLIQGPGGTPLSLGLQWRSELDQPGHRRTLGHRCNRSGGLFVPHLTLRLELRKHHRQGWLKPVCNRPRQQSLLRQPHHRRGYAHRSHRDSGASVHSSRCGTR
ncbi:MAG: hypothetical protein JWQ49_3514 [Edaphobacter sp.]|nr:hypothetical protein [Edaphobacter sp.]